MESTLLIIKPDAFERKLVGNIINRLERAGFEIIDLKVERLSAERAREFYTVHEGKSFLDALVEFMSSGPVVPILLRKDNAISDLRTLIGATDVQRNSVHASDSPANAKTEIAFFFG
jgi:nucleoside-diphosphate kinase